MRVRRTRDRSRRKRCARRSSSWGSPETRDVEPIDAAERAAETVRALAGTTRFAGSMEETLARHYCTGRLRGAGFAVKEEEFEYSRVPANLVLPVASTLFAVTSWLIGHLATAHAAPAAALAVAFAGTAVISLAVRYLTGRGVQGFPWGRAIGVNLVAVRGDGPPSEWLVAHLDSKSQSIPMLLRIVSVSAVGVFFALTVGSVIAMLVVDSTGGAGGVLSHRLAHTVDVHSVFAMLAALPLLLCVTTNRSPGALDNASGVATIILAAERLEGRPIGVLISSAEELGLAGARSFAEMRKPGPTVINCDTIDDSGRFICMASGRRSARLDAAIDRACRRTAIDTRRPRSTRFARLCRMLPGVLADNVAFTRAGWEAFTVSRGNLRTLARVHTSRDHAGHITGTAIAQAAHLMAATVEELT